MSAKQLVDDIVRGLLAYVIGGVSATLLGGTATEQLITSLVVLTILNQCTRKATP